MLLEHSPAWPQMPPMNTQRPLKTPQRWTNYPAACCSVANENQKAEMFQDSEAKPGMQICYD